MSRRHTTAAIVAVAAVAAPAFADAGTRVDEVRLFDWIRTFWPIIVVFATMLVAAVMTGLATRFVKVPAFNGLIERVGKLETGCQGHEMRLQSLERSAEKSPTPMELQEDIAELAERMKGVETGLTGIDGRLETTNTYLHTLIERGLKGAA